MSREPDEPPFFPVDHILYETAADRFIKVRCVREPAGAAACQGLFDDEDLQPAPWDVFDRAVEASFQEPEAGLRDPGWCEQPDGT